MSQRSSDVAREQRRTEFLGMSFGTAKQQLRKQILFYLLKKHHENICFRCKKEIGNIDELSIEHKEPWEGRSIQLFWDMENIAFSHIRCNLPHSYNMIRLRERPEGTDWCVSGKHFAPIENFFKNAGYRTGRQKWCKDHRPDR